VPASSNIAPIAGEARAFVRGCRARNCNGDCNLLRLRRIRTLLCRVPQSVWRKSFADAASRLTGQYFSRQPCCPKHSPFRNLRASVSTIPP